MNRKRTMELAGSLIIAIILIGSYALAGAGGNATTTTTVGQTQQGYAAWYAYNITNASILGYGSDMVINVTCSNSSLEGRAVNFTSQQLSGINQSAGLGENQFGNQIYLTFTNTTAADVYSFAESRLAGTAYAGCPVFNAFAMVGAFRSLRFHASPIYGSGGGGEITIAMPSQYQTFTLPVRMNSSMRSKLLVKVYTLLNGNFSIYGNVSASVV